MDRNISYYMGRNKDIFKYFFVSIDDKICVGNIRIKKN